VLALETNVAGEVFQIATERETSISRLAELVAEVGAGGSATIEHGASRVGDIRSNFSSIRKANSVLGWSPSTSLEDGLEQTWRWLRDDFRP
jgi:nucleoside-diphosphate-sugar epimerase